MDYIKKRKGFNLGLLILVVVIIVFLIYANHIKKTEDEKYLKDYQLLSFAVNNLSKGKVDSQTELIMNNLYQKYPNDYKIIWYSGNLYLQQNKLQRAQYFYQRALNRNSLLLRNASFTYQYAQLLYLEKSYENATKMLNIEQETPNASKYKNQVNKLLDNIKRMNGNNGNK